MHTVYRGVKKLQIKLKGAICMSGVAGAGYGAGYGGFALLIVLFILLVIIGASWYGGYGAY